MPSFLIRGLARYFAASAMESRARRQSTFTPSSGTSSDDNKKLSEADLAGWQIHMRWLIPLAQATGYQIVIDNPKSHEQIIIDQNTKVLPELTLEWMQRYNKQELLEWIAKDKERQQQEEEERRKNLEARRIEEARGRARFGNSFTLSEQNTQDKKRESLNDRKGKYVMPILCLIYVFIIFLVGLWVYNSAFFDSERHDKDWVEYNTIMHEAEDSPITEHITPEGFWFDMNEDEFNAINKQNTIDGSTKSDWLLGNIHYVGYTYSGEFHDGKLISYEIIIRGSVKNGTILKLNNNDINNICDHYRAILDKDYTYTKLSDYYYWIDKNSQIHLFTKHNMAITIDYHVFDYSSEDNHIRIKCENRPISAKIERERERIKEEERQKKYRPRFQSQYPYSRL
jgi:hypothetical protein